MKTIIKPGKKEFIMTCPRCGCQFTYELSDVGCSSVICPDCSGYCYHPNQDGEAQVQRLHVGDSPAVEKLKHQLDQPHALQIDPYTHYYESVTPTCPTPELTTETPTPIDPSLCSTSGRPSDNIKLTN